MQTILIVLVVLFLLGGRGLGIFALAWLTRLADQPACVRVDLYLPDAR